MLLTLSMMHQFYGLRAPIFCTIANLRVWLLVSAACVVHGVSTCRRDRETVKERIWAGLRHFRLTPP